MSADWDDYYWELEHGTQALKWIKAKTLAQLEDLTRGMNNPGAYVMYKGQDVIEMAKARLAYMRTVWMGNRRKMSDVDFLWAMPGSELSAFKATGLSIAEYRKRMGCEFDSPDQTPKPEVWGDFS